MICRTFTCIAVVPVANHIVADLEGHPDKKASVLLVTIWELGEAAGPLIIAPLSEVIGRYPVMNACNVGFILSTLLASFAPTASVLIAARFLTGLAVASNVLNPSIVGDMFISAQRGTAMSLIMLAPLVGGAIGPAISGAIAETMGWREMLWICAGLATLCEIAFLTFFRETFKVPILNRRAAKLRKETGDPTYRTVFEVESAERKGSQLWEQILRPFVVLAGSGVLQALSLIEAVGFTYFYVMSTTLPSILEELYGLSAAATGAAFISFSKSTFPLPSTPHSLTSLLHSRRGLRHQRSPLQPTPRQNLHQPPRRKQGHRATRIPAPARHLRKHFPPTDRRTIRLGRPIATPRILGPALSRRARSRSHARHAPPHGLRRRCFWHVLCICHDGRHRDEVSDGDIFTPGHGTPD